MGINNVNWKKWKADQLKCAVSLFPVQIFLKNPYFIQMLFEVLTSPSAILYVPVISIDMSHFEVVYT